MHASEEDKLPDEQLLAQIAYVQFALRTLGYLLMMKQNIDSGRGGHHIQRDVSSATPPGGAT